MVIGTPNTHHGQTQHHRKNTSTKHITSAKNEHKPRSPNTNTKYNTSATPRERERERERDVCERVVGEQARVSERQSSERATGRCVCVCVRERERENARERHRDARAKVV